MGKRTVGYAAGKVRDAGDARYLHAHVICRNGFAGGGHSHSVCAKGTNHSYLRGGLVVGACKLDLYALSEPDVKVSCGVADYLTQLLAVYLAHIGEAGAKLIGIFADKG